MLLLCRIPEGQEWRTQPTVKQHSPLLQPAWALLPTTSQMSCHYRFSASVPLPVQGAYGRQTGHGRLERDVWARLRTPLLLHMYIFPWELEKGSISLIAFKRRLPACLHVNRLCRLSSHSFTCGLVSGAICIENREFGDKCSMLTNVKRP